MAEERKHHHARDVSLASMIVAAVWIGALSLLKCFWALLSTEAFGLEMHEILWSGLVIAAVFSPVYLSIVLDKVRDIRVG